MPHVLMFARSATPTTGLLGMVAFTAGLHRLDEQGRAKFDPTRLGGVGVTRLMDDDYQLALNHLAIQPEPMEWQYDDIELPDCDLCEMATELAFWQLDSEGYYPRDASAAWCVAWCESCHRYTIPEVQAPPGWFSALDMSTHANRRTPCSCGIRSPQEYRHWLIERDDPRPASERTGYVSDRLYNGSSTNLHSHVVGGTISSSHTHGTTGRG